MMNKSASPHNATHGDDAPPATSSQQQPANNILFIVNHLNTKYLDQCVESEQKHFIIYCIITNYK